MTGRAKSAAVFCVASLLGVFVPAAEAWEFAYGPPKTLDQGARRVAPVAWCPGGGYVAVGTQDLGGADPDVYVVRTDDSGAPLWEYVYDVQQAGRRNEGIAIGEDQNGFVFLSNTFDGRWYPSLTRIDCDGGQVWTWAYPDATGQNLWGRDLIRSVNGDWAVAGIWRQESGNEDGFLLRADPFGNRLWDMTYHGAGQENFHALTEAARLPDQALPDLVAVGRFSGAGPDVQGLVARVAGDSGLMSGASHCFAEQGTMTTDEAYESAARLRTFGTAGQIAITGSVTDQGDAQSDLLVVTADPCTILDQIRIGTDPPPGSSEKGYDIREVMKSFAGVPLGSLAIAGSHQAQAGVDAALLFVAMSPLQPISGSLFGDHAGSSEIFLSLAEDLPASGQATGFVLAGLTENDWQGSGDGRDLYLAHYDPNAAACHQEWSPQSRRTRAAVRHLPKRIHPRVSPSPLPAPAAPRLDPHPICP